MATRGRIVIARSVSDEAIQICLAAARLDRFAFGSQ
jgi:hypothetical protein